jgi:uncharacterized protein
MRRWLRAVYLVLFFAFTAAAVDWKALKPQGYVSDFAGVIGPASRTDIERYAGAVERATGAQMALVTIPSLNGEPIEDVANTIFRAWGVGKKGKDEGILLLLAVNDRKSRLEVGYGLEPILPDGFSGSILRQMRPALRNQQYGEALKAAAQTIGSTIANAKHVSIETPLPRSVPPETGSDIPWGFIIFAGIILLMVFRSRGPRGYGGGGGGFWPGLILGNVLTRGSWGSRGSGGFGGYDSGDGGFGGFGGGDSGGGGASSDW